MKNNQGINAAKSADILRRINRQLRTLTPVGASQRQMYAVSRNYDYAVQEIRAMQKKFNEEREQIFRKIHNTSSAPKLKRYKKDIQKQGSRPVSPKPVERVNSISPWSRTPTPYTPRKTPKQVDLTRLTTMTEEKPIDSILNKCSLLHTRIVRPPSNNPYKSFLKVLEKQQKREVRYAETKHYIDNKQYLLKCDNTHLLSKDSFKRYKRDNFKNFLYVSCRLNKKKIWKQSGEVLPKRAEQMISNYMNASFL